MPLRASQSGHVRNIWEFHRGCIQIAKLEYILAAFASVRSQKWLFYRKLNNLAKTTDLTQIGLHVIQNDDDITLLQAKRRVKKTTNCNECPFDYREMWGSYRINHYLYC
jgi:hypothetical protein